MEKAMFAQICRLCFDLIPFLKRKKASWEFSSGNHEKSTQEKESCTHR